MASIWIITTFSRNPRRSGGVGVHMAALESGFRRLGYEVEVVSRESLGRPLAFFITALNGLDLLVHPLGCLAKAWAGRHAMGRHLKRRMRGNGEAVAPRLIIFEDLYAAVPLGSQPVVGFVHALDSEEQRRSPRLKSLLLRHSSRALLNLYRRLEDRAAVALPRWATVSEEYRQHLAEIGLPLPAGRGGVIHPGIDVASLQQQCRRGEREPGRSSAGAFTMVCTGVFTARKNQAFLLEVLRQLPPWVRLVLIGDGVERARLQARAAELGLGDRVLFRGFLTGEEKAAALAEGDLFVFPSLKESFGIALLEAKVCGLPTLAAPLEVPSVLVDSVQPLDPARWAGEVLRFVAQSRASAHDDPDRPRFDARPFSDVRMAEEVLALVGGSGATRGVRQ